MKENLIEAINCEDDFQDELFFTIVETTDVLEKAQFIEAVRRKCQKVGRLREFTNLLKAWILKSTQLQKRGSSNKTAFTDYRLSSEIRQAHRKKEEEQEKEIQRVGFVLADFHRFLWQSIHLYPFNDKRHIWALEELTTCEYFLDCYDAKTAESCKYNMGVVRRYEQELSRFGERGSDTGGKRLQVLSQEDREESGG